MNQDLENYIKQSREAGKSDEIIKQELRASGWSEVEISQALGTQTVPSTVSGTSITTWLTAKTLAIIIAALVAMGGSAYFIFSDKDSMPTNQTDNNSKVAENTANKADFHCKDLLPDVDFQTILKKNSSEYVLKEQNNDLSKGEGTTQDFKDKFGNQFQQGARVFVCSYSTPDNPVGDIYFLLGYGTKNDLTAEFQSQKDVAFSFNGKEIQIADQIIKGPDDYAESIADLGADAYRVGFKEVSNTVHVLSSNRKYMLTVTVNADKFLIDVLISAKEIAKVIDTNLSKY